jgi:hypothetical protein
VRRVRRRGSKFDEHFLALPATVKREVGRLINAVRVNPNYEFVMDIRWTRANAAGQCETILTSGYRLLWSVEEAIIVWDVLPPLPTFNGVGYPEI